MRDDDVTGYDADAGPPAPAAPAPMATPSAWAARKGVSDFDLAGAAGCERAAGRWPLHGEPDVTEAAFDAAVESFRNLSLG